MASDSHTDDKFKEKKRPKNPIKFNIPLNEEQKSAKAEILKNAITILTGKAGSGKTLLACQIALDQIFMKEVERIIIARPTVTKEDIGFLPGDIKEKMDPWLQPIYANLYMLYSKVKIDKMFEDGEIEIIPVGFMRGRTFVDSFVIVDEAQNITHEQMQMVATRLGKNSKMVLCGHLRQNDLKRKTDTGFGFIVELTNKIEELGIFELQKNHRHGIVEQILKEYEDKESQK